MSNWLMSSAPPISDKMMLPAGLGEATVNFQEVSQLELALQRRREDVGYISAPVAIGLRTSERMNAGVIVATETNAHGSADDTVVQSLGSDVNDVIERRTDNVIDDDEVASDSSSDDGYAFNDLGHDNHGNSLNPLEGGVGNLDEEEDDDDDDEGEDDINGGEEVYGGDLDNGDDDDDDADDDDDDLTAFL